MIIFLIIELSLARKSYIFNLVILLKSTIKIIDSAKNLRTNLASLEKVVYF